MATNFEVSGINELISRLGEISQNIEDSFEDTLKETAENMLEDMKQTTAFHDRTGNLRASLDVTEVKGSGIKKNIKVGANYKKKGNHAHLLEEGTSKMKARPFIGPTYINKKAETIEKIKEALRRAVES